jgi:hypothetical protein
MRKVGGKAAVPVKAPAKKPAASAKTVEVNPTHYQLEVNRRYN